MESALKSALGLSLALALSACASAAGEYPSLAIRDSERVTGSLETPEAPLFTPTPAAPATLEQLGELADTAREAHQRFLAAADDARGTVRSAAGSSIGSENWSRAQVAVAGLESRRSNAMIALADADRIFVEAATNGGEIAEAEAARAEIAALVEEENRVIAGLLGIIGS